ncbi:winged-helix domain-containing protein [Parasynechococcus sp.]|jgi:two-component system response regulator MprA|uniref:winged helix-turn-helix transcriptional regulator n=1 Tax=Parasynechococcus sp. TaxID=3101203 RepID=UPI003703745A
MTPEPLLLLAGPAALALAQRLSVSGYSTVDWLSAGVTSSSATQGQEPTAAILGADQSTLIGDLRQRFGAMPILLDLVTDSVEARAGCLCLGADDFWLSTGPPSDLLLRLRLHRSLSSRQGGTPSCLQFEDLRLDPLNRAVHRSGRPIALTTREYSLLEVFLQQPGQVFSRDELLRLVWQGDSASSSNVVEVYVRYVRQKLEATGESRLLHTVRGRGYCLGAERSGG